MDKVSKVGAGVGATGGSLSRRAVETGIGVTEELLRRSVTGGTWAAYSSVWGEWSNLVSSVGRNVSQQEYLAWLLYFILNGFAQGTSVSKMNKSLAALAFFFRSQGLMDVTKDFRVRQAMKGFRKGRVHPDSRHPVSFDLLQELVGLLPGVCTSNYEVRLFTVAFSLAFFGALRIGELVSKNRSGAGGLQLNDVTMSGECVQIHISKSKTDQLGKGVSVSLFRVLPASVCPVSSVQRYLEA